MDESATDAGRAAATRTPIAKEGGLGDAGP